MKRLVILSYVALLVLAGCMTTPGQIQTHKSSFDGMEEVSMNPGWVSKDTAMGPAAMKLGLHWNSTDPDYVRFIAEIPLEIINIQSSEGLQFNIDGQIVKLSSPSVTTDFDTYAGGDSSKRFIGKLDLVRRIIEAETVMVKLVTSGGYLEGNLKAAPPMSAIKNMPEFLATVNQKKGN